MHSIAETLAVVLHAPQPMSYFRHSGMDGFAVVTDALMNKQKGVAAMSPVRYSRQQNFRPIGDAGQQALRDAHVLIVDAGALGSGKRL